MRRIACSASAGADRPAELVTSSPFANTSGRADLFSPAWSQWTQRSFGAARWRSSRSPAITATSASRRWRSIAASSRAWTKRPAPRQSRSGSTYGGGQPTVASAKSIERVVIGGTPSPGPSPSGRRDEQVDRLEQIEARQPNVRPSVDALDRQLLARDQRPRLAGL